MTDFISAKKVNKFITANDYKINHETLDHFVKSLKNKNSKLFRGVGGAVQAGGHVSSPSEYYGSDSGRYSEGNLYPYTDMSSANAISSTTRPAIDSAEFPLNSSLNGDAGALMEGGCGCASGALTGGGRKRKNVSGCGCCRDCKCGKGCKGKCKCKCRSCKCHCNQRGGVGLSDTCGVQLQAPEPLVDPNAPNANDIPFTFGEPNAPNIDNLAGGARSVPKLFTQKDAKLISRYLGLNVAHGGGNYTNLAGILSVNLAGITSDLFGQVKNRDRVIGKSHINKCCKNK